MSAPQPLVDAGVAAFNAGRPREALLHLEAALRAAPTDASLRLLRAHALRACGRAAPALREVRALVRSRPRDARLRLALIELLGREGRRAEALSESWRALRSDPRLWSAAPVRAALAAALERPGGARALARGCAASLRRAPEPAGVLLLADLARALDDAGLWRSVAACAARARPQAAVLEALCEALRRLGRPLEALSAVRRLTRLEPRSGPHRLRAAWLLREAGRPAAALAQARRAAALGAEGALPAAAAFAAEAGRHGEAARLLEGCDRRDPRARLALAQALADAGRPEEALAAAEAAARLSAGSSEAWRLALGLARRLDRPERALAARRRLAALCGWDAEGLLEASELCLRLGRRRSAAALRARALRLLRRRAPRDWAAALALARALAEDGRLSPALRLAASAARARAKDAGARRLEAELLSRLGRPAEALDALERAARLEEWTEPARLEAAAALLRLDRPEEALAHASAAGSAGRALRFKALLELGRRGAALAEAGRALRRGASQAEVLWAVDAFESLGRLDLSRRAAQAAARQGGAEGLLSLARLELWAGAAARARRLAERSLQAAPSAAAWTVRGAARTLERDWAAAERDLARALALEPGAVEARVWRAEALRRAGRPERALRELGVLWRALPAERRPLGAWANWILARRALGRPVPASAWRLVMDSPPWRQICPGQIDPESTELLERLLASMRGNRGPRPTFVWAAEARRARPRLRLQTRAETMQLQAALRFGDGPGILREFDRLIREDPRAAYSWSSRGELCLWLGRPAQARRSVSRALALSPDLPWPNIGLCGAAVLEGDLDRAWAALERASSVGAGPQYSGVWRGEILRRRGLAREALEALAQVKAEPPYRPGLWLNRALCLLDLGRRDEAGRLLRLLRARLPALFAEAGPGAPRRVLERALSLMRGNRSSWLYTFVDRRGRLRHLKVAGVRPERVPASFRGSPWMFARP